MKTITAPLNLLFLLILATFHPSLYSQEQTDISKLIVGGTYKIVLFDDTEVRGKVTVIDSVNVTVELPSKNVMIVPRNNILYYSSDLSPAKHEFSCSLMGGVSMLTEEDSYYSYYGNNRNNNIVPNLNLAGIFFLSDVKAIKIDLGYSFIKLKTDNTYYAYYTEYPSTFEGGNTAMYSLKGNILFGKFDPKERFTFYGSVGLGVHLTSRDAITEKYWIQNYSDSTWTQHTSYREAENYFNALLSLGASAGYRFSRHFGAKIEIEYNIVTSEGLFFFYGGRSYFPFRAGIFYIF